MSNHELAPDTIVTAVIAGREVAAKVVDDAGTRAAYGPGPTEYYRLDVPGAGTYRVPETDITAPT